MKYIKVKYLIIAPFLYAMEVSITASDTLDREAYFKAADLFIGCGNLGWCIKSPIEGFKQYSVAVLRNDEIIPLSHKNVTLNGSENVDNPLYNAGIAHVFQYAVNLPCVIPQNKGDVYILTKEATKRNNASYLSVAGMEDAEGNPAQRIVTATPLVFRTDTKDKRLFSKYIALAIEPHKGTWGDARSGIGLVKLEPKAPEDDKGIAASITGASNVEIEGMRGIDPLTGKSGKKAFPFFSSEVFKNQSANGSVEVVSDRVHMLWDAHGMRLYLSLHVKTNAHALSDDYACGLFVGKIVNDALSFYPIIPEEIMKHNEDMTICGRGPNQEVCVLRTAILKTSTDLHYLIIWGGKGTADEANKKFYAVPLTMILDNNKNDAMHHGRIASLDHEPYLFHKNPKFKVYHGKCNTVAAKTEEQFKKAFAHGAIGGEQDLPGTVFDFSIVDDVVYVQTLVDGQTCLYASTPVFDENGFIVRWSAWRGIGAFAEKVRVLYTDEFRMLRIGIEKDNTIKYVGPAWESKSSNTFSYQFLMPVLGNYFNEKNPISLINYFGSKEIGLTHNMPGGVLAFAGHNTIVMALTGLHSKNVLQPVEECIPVQLGAKKYDEHKVPNTLIINDKELGTIQSMTIVSNGIMDWLIIGSTQGCFILSDSQGNGWQKGNFIEQLPYIAEHMSVKKLFNYQAVKNVIFYEDTLYVVTRDALHNIDIKQPRGVWSSECIIQAKSFSALFTHCCINNNVFIAGTTKGIWYVPLVDIKEKSKWNKVINSRIENIHVQDIAFSPAFENTEKPLRGSQLLALGNSLSDASCYLFRLYLSYGDAKQAPYIKEVISFTPMAIQTPFITFNDTKKGIGTDDILLLSVTQGKKVYVNMLNILMSNARLTAKSIAPVDIFTKKTTISNLVYDEMRQLWLVASGSDVASYGMKVN